MRLPAARTACGGSKAWLIPSLTAEFELLEKSNFSSSSTLLSRQDWHGCSCNKLPTQCMLLAIWALSTINVERIPAMVQPCRALEY